MRFTIRYVTNAIMTRPTEKRVYDIIQLIFFVIMENSDMPPMLAIKFNGIKTMLITVRRLIKIFELLFTIDPLASMSPVRMLE